MHGEDDLHKERIIQIEKGRPVCGEDGLCTERMVHIQRGWVIRCIEKIIQRLSMHRDDGRCIERMVHVWRLYPYTENGHCTDVFLMILSFLNALVYSPLYT